MVLQVYANNLQPRPGYQGYFPPYLGEADGAQGGQGAVHQAEERSSVNDYLASYTQAQKQQYFQVCVAYGHFLS